MLGVVDAYFLFLWRAILIRLRYLCFEIFLRRHFFTLPIASSQMFRRAGGSLPVDSYAEAAGRRIYTSMVALSSDFLTGDAGHAYSEPRAPVACGDRRGACRP